MPLFFGFVGLFTFLMGWPVGIILHLMKVEKFELPSTRTMIIALVANVKFDSPLPRRFELIPVRVLAL